MKRFLLLLVMIPSFLAAEESSSISLEECFQRAVVRNETVLIQGEEVRAAEGRYWQALGGTLPHLTAKGSELIQDTSGTSSGGSEVGSTFVRRSRPEVKVTLEQPLFQGFREFRALSASKADRRRSELQTERAGQILFLGVAQVYLSILEFERDLELLKSQRSVTQKRVQELKGRVQIGKSRKAEVLTTESKLALIDAEIARAEGRVAIARETLASLTGLPQEQTLKGIEETVGPIEPVEFYLTRKTVRPDVAAEGFELKLSKTRLAYERGGYLPELKLEANYYPYRVGFLSEIDWDLLFSLEVPLFQGGLTHGRVKEAKARLKQAELGASESDREADLEIREAYHDLSSSREEVHSLKIASEKAAQNYKLQSQEYRLGLVTNLEVLQSLRDWYDVERQANQTIHRSLLNAYRLKVATGEIP